MQFGVSSIQIVRQSHSLYCQLQSEKIPLVFVQDVTGFMVGSKSEQGGIIKDGAKLMQ
jgi:acetyl-CoA carboxylase carboxyltransferase component